VLPHVHASLMFPHTHDALYRITRVTRSLTASASLEEVRIAGVELPLATFLRVSTLAKLGARGLSKLPYLGLGLPTFAVAPALLELMGLALYSPAHQPVSTASVPGNSTIAYPFGSFSGQTTVLTKDRLPFEPLQERSSCKLAFVRANVTVDFQACPVGGLSRWGSSLRLSSELS